jgi:hypothetical protein
MQHLNTLALIAALGGIANTTGAMPDTETLQP